jgi:hypothetical protein
VGGLPLGTKGGEIHEERAPKGRDLRGNGVGGVRRREMVGGGEGRGQITIVGGLGETQPRASTSKC